MTFNAQSITKTKLYRTIRDQVMQETGLTDSEVRGIIGPLVEKHIKSSKQRQTAATLTKKLLDQAAINDIPSLMVKDGVVVETGGGNTQPPVEDDPLLKDTHSLMALFRRAKHEHSLTRAGMAKALNVSENSIRNWLYKTDTVPMDKNVAIIATYLQGMNYTIDIPARFR